MLLDIISYRGFACLLADARELLDARRRYLGGAVVVRLWSGVGPLLILMHRAGCIVVLYCAVRSRKVSNLGTYCLKYLPI